MATSPASVSVSYKTILLATDFLSSSEAALPYLLNLARSFDSTVLAAHAVPFKPVAGLGAVPPIADIDYDWQSAREAMHNYEVSHPFAGLRHEFLLERGEPHTVVADIVERRGVDLVVQGSHGRRGLRKVFAGSVAEEVFRTVPCPVLTVGPNVAPLAEEPWRPRRILFATEFAEGSVHALPHALAIAEANHAELLVLHTVALVPWEEKSEMAVQTERKMAELIPPEVKHRCSVEFRVCFELPAPGILETASERNCDLIVMGVHHAHFPRVDAHLVGTTACEVISQAHCPVLTVRD